MKDFTAERANEYRKAAAACALLKSEAAKITRSAISGRAGGG